MGSTDTVVFTYHRRHHKEVITTVNKCGRALQGILLPASYNKLGLSSHTQHPSKLEAIQSESDYLDGFLNLEHCSDMDINKKRKKDDDTVGGHTAILGLTNVSPQSHNTTTPWPALPFRTRDCSPIKKCSDKEAHQTRLSTLESANRKNKQIIEEMTQKLSQMKSSIASLVNTQKHTTDKLTKQKKWQIDVSSQLSKVAQGQIALGEIAKQLTDDNKLETPGQAGLMLS